MGAEESKSSGSSGCPSFASTAVDFPNCFRRESEAVAWTLLHQTTVDKWKDGHAEAANFEETTLSCDDKDCTVSFCISRQGILNISKSSTIFSFRKRSRFYKMAEHFEYNHIPAQMLSINHFRVLSVLCFRESLVVLTLLRNGLHQFGLLNLHANKFLGVFGKQNSSNARSMFGAISPDKSKCLVRVGLQDNTYQLHLYDLKTNRLLQQTDGLTTPVHFAFDPCHAWKLVAVTNVRPRHSNTLSILQLDTWALLSTNTQVNDAQATLYPYMQDLQYTPDGSLLIATVIVNACFCNNRSSQIYRPVSGRTYVFDGETACTLRCIEYQRFSCTIHMCPTNHTPLFSSCGSRMAIVVNQPDQPKHHYVQIYKLPHVLSLQSLCRVIIRQNFSPEAILDLPLPVKLINFLCFKPWL